jgi:beta-ribofuranosylaminobenzene 5'-phosphate synthase
VTRVTAPSRLHFGLLSLPAAGPDRWPGLDGNPGQPVRHFGGVGLMVDRPGLVVRIEPANEWSAAGLLADRALGFARRVVDSLPTDERRPFRVEVEAAPAEHTGLGVGTQLALAVAKGIAVELGHEWPVTELATRVGRGERSAIGVHGFALGGLIVEGGKRAGEAVSPLVGRYAFPNDWAILLVIPPGPVDWHGGRERQAFARLSELGPGLAETDARCRLVLTGILPALVSEDLDAFGEAVYEFNARVGDVFAPAQGGRYASPAVADVIARLRARGLRGVGQSSWGPTVFAIVRRPEAEALAQELAPAVVAGASAGVITAGPAK